MAALVLQRATDAHPDMSTPDAALVQTLVLLPPRLPAMAAGASGAAQAQGTVAQDCDTDNLWHCWPAISEGYRMHPPAASRQAWTHPRETTHFPVATPIRYLEVRLQQDGQAGNLAVAPAWEYLLYLMICKKCL